jgi:hypothetical protein
MRWERENESKDSTFRITRKMLYVRFSSFILQVHSSRNPSEYSPSNPNQISESDNDEQLDGGDHIVKYKKETKVLSERV